MPVPMTVAWWRCAEEPPRSRRVMPGDPEPTYRLPCDADVEGVWRASGLLPNIRNTRRRCESFRVATEAEVDTEWTIRNWGRTWNVSAERIEEVLLTARALRDLGRYHGLVVYDGDRPISGITNIDDGGDLVGQALFRDRAYDRFSLGTFMFDRHVAWAVERGFKGVDFGGSVPYKERWAPVGGRKFTVAVTPLVRVVGDAVRAPWRAIRRLAAAAPGGAPAAGTREGEVPL
jgi:hypothetical protein